MANLHLSGRAPGTWHSEALLLLTAGALLGEGGADGPGAPTDGTIFAKVTRYHCATGQMIAFVIPSAHTPEEVVDAVDAELAAMDIEYFSPLAVDLVIT